MNDGHDTYKSSQLKLISRLEPKIWKIVHLETSITVDILQVSHSTTSNPPKNRFNFLLIERRMSGNQIEHKWPTYYHFFLFTINKILDKCETTGEAFHYPKAYTSLNFVLTAENWISGGCTTIERTSSGL